MLNNKKFDLRIYVLVSSVEPMTAFVAKEGLVRICTIDYHTPNKDNMHILLTHLTNFSLNKLSD